MAQIVWMTVVRAAPSYRAENKFASWLLRLARNTCIDELRLHRERFEIPTEEVEDLAESTTAFATDLEKAQTLAQIKTKIDALPDAQRAVFVMWMNEELSYEQIASQLKISEAAVKSLLFRARQTLKAGMEKLS